MIIKQTNALTWHISNDDGTPAGVVDLDGETFVALKHGADIHYTGQSLDAAAESLKA